MGIQINGNTDNISAVDGGLTVSDLELNQTGVSTFHSHLHVADQIIHLDDANTKIRFPANDTVSIETSGSEALRIYSDGDAKFSSKLGVGVEPVETFDVRTTGTAIALIGSTNASGAYLKLDGDSNGDGSGGDYARLVHDTDGRLYIDNLKSTADIVFRNTSSATERLRITSGGKVNIGGDYTNTTSTLRVIGDSNAGSQTYLEKNSGSTNNTYNSVLTLSSRSTGSAAANYGPAMSFQHAFGGTNYAGSLIASQCNSDVNTADLVFYPRNYGYTEALRITSGGDTTINGDLTVTSGTSGDAKLIIEADTDNNEEGDNPTLVFKQDGGIEVSSIGHGLLSGDQNGLVLANSCANGYMSFATGSTNGHTNATERLRIRDNGNIGIGNRTSSPDNLLHVHTASGDSVIHVEAAADPKLRLRAHSGESIIQFADASSSNVGEINYVHSGDYLKFHVNGSEKMRIDSSGNLTKPNSCCFQAVVNGSHVSANSYVVFGSVDVNKGNDYNSSNGIFTAPVAGTYLFHISSIAFNNATTVYRFYLRINNGNTGSGSDAHLRIDRSNNGYANQYGTNASYTYYKAMNANDTARVWFTPDNGSGNAYGGSDYFKFAGHLVG